MGQRSPLVTLAAMAAGFLALLVVDSTQTGSPAPAAAYPSASVPTSPATTSPPTTSSGPPPQPSQTAAPKQTATPATTVPSQRTVVYVGKTAAREATVALAVKGGRAVAYVCDGRRLEAWLTGTVADGKVALRSRTGERLVATLSSTTATGSFTLRGRTIRFGVGVAGPPAGLYRSSGKSGTIGWIVLPDGSQVGIDNDGTPAPAPHLDPVRRLASVGGVPVTARSIAGDETF